jgi:hypothetical protein
MAKIKRDISYFTKDFSDFRQQLIEFSKIYFPNTYNDFTPSSPGMMFIEQSAYVGDVLGFYLDNQIQENFIQYARQTDSIYELAYMFGYKPKISSAAQVEISIYQQLPAKTVSGNIVPDFDYALTVGENTQIFSNSGGSSFIIQDKIDFSISSSQDPTEVTLYQTSGGNPEYYLLKKTRKALSAEVKSTTFNFGSPTKFPTIQLTDSSFLKILDVKDSQGGKWYEVDYLGQEMVYDKIKNTNIYDPNNEGNEGEVPYILKLKKVQKRFATRILQNNTIQLQFGAGTTQDNDEEIIPNSNNVGLGLPFKQDKLTTSFSPTNFLYTDTYGISPSNTNLTVRYLSGGGVSSNVDANTLNNLDTSNTKFNNNNLNPTTADYIFNSIVANNDEAASGGGSGNTLEEIRQNVLATISSQQRSVTQDDYLVRAFNLPSDYGSISKAIITKPLLTDNQTSTSETLNLFCLSKDSQGYLSQPSQTLKRNLRTYLSQYRMIGDNIEIRDAFIINIGVNFDIIVLPDYNSNEVLSNCIVALQEYFAIQNWQINQPIILRDIYVLLDNIEGVQTVKTIDINNKVGEYIGYSPYSYDIKGATVSNVIYPSLDPSIFEVKYPNTDIQGRVVSL